MEAIEGIIFEGEERLNQLPKLWSRRTTSEWKPRRASVASCQQHQRQLMNHHQNHKSACQFSLTLTSGELIIQPQRRHSRHCHLDVGVRDCDSEDTRKKTSKTGQFERCQRAIQQLDKSGCNSKGFAQEHISCSSSGEQKLGHEGCDLRSSKQIESIVCSNEDNHSNNDNKSQLKSTKESSNSNTHKFYQTGQNSDTLENDDGAKEIFKNDSSILNDSDILQQVNKVETEQDTSESSKSDTSTLGKKTARKSVDLNGSLPRLCQSSSRRGSQCDSVSLDCPGTSVRKSHLLDQIQQLSIARDLAMTQSVNEKLKLHQQQRKYLILSMALKQMLTNPDLYKKKQEAEFPALVTISRHQGTNKSVVDGGGGKGSSCRSRSCSFGLARSPRDTMAIRAPPSRQVFSESVAMSDSKRRDQNSRMVRSNSDLENAVTAATAAVAAVSEAYDDYQRHSDQILSETLSHLQDNKKPAQRRENCTQIEKKSSCNLGKAIDRSVLARHSVSTPGKASEVDFGIMRQLIISRASNETDITSDSDDLENEPMKGKAPALECDQHCEFSEDLSLGQEVSDEIEWQNNSINQVNNKTRESNNNNNNNNTSFDSEEAQMSHRCGRRSHSVSQDRRTRNSATLQCDLDEKIDQSEINLEALIIESWLDDHPEFTHDYFVRKANRQLIDDWLLAHARVNNTNISPQLDLQSINLLSGPISQLSLSNPRSAGFVGDVAASWRTAGAVVDVNADQTISSVTNQYDCNAGDSAMPALWNVGRSTRSDSQSGGPSLSAYLSLSGAMTPVRKISATDFESRTGSGFLRSMLSTTPDGRLTFLTPPSQQYLDTGNEEIKQQRIDSHNYQQQNNELHHHYHQSNRKSSTSSFIASQKESKDKVMSINGSNLIESQAKTDIGCKDKSKAEDNEEQSLKVVNNEPDLKSVNDSTEGEQLNGEVKLIFELVKNICDDLDIRTLLHKILKNIAVLINADRSSLFLVRGEQGDPDRHLVSQLFNVDQDSAEVDELEDCITIPWGKGLVGYVAESGEFVNIADCYNDPRFTNAIDQRTGYLTKHMLCAPIFDKRGEIVGVAQVINKRDGNPFSKSDEIKFKRYLQFCGIGLRNAQSYEYCQLENKRNQVLLDLARMVFEEQSSIEEVVYRIMLHTQSLLDCERCQVLLIDNGTDDIENLLRDSSNTSNDRSSRYTDSLMTSARRHATNQVGESDWRPHLQNVSDHLRANEQGGLGKRMFQDNISKAGRHEQKPSPKLFSLVFDLECDGANNPVVYSCGDNSSKNSRSLNANKRRARNFPINIGITRYVAMTGETLNIEDAHAHERFDPTVDEGSDFKHRSILCMPIRNGRRQIIGVSQLINKKNGRPFNKNDEDLFEAFSIFCGLGIHNTLMYERVLKIMAKQRVTFEVLSYHATAPLEEAKKLHQEQIPSCFALNLASLKFNDFSLDDQYMLKSCLRFFLDLDLMRRFQIDQLVFCNWVLSVQKNYRKVTYHPIVGGNGLTASPVRYHNWRHAFNVSQMMFAILVNTQICHALGELETLALLIACLCHDLDHRGTNNSFQIKSASPLAELYSTSTMEHHHFDQCVMILNSQGNQILANLTPEEYSKVIVLLEEAIIATDLANYFQKRDLFFQLVNSNKFDWRTDPEHRSLLRCMLMTACDIAAITKPWPVQKVVADLVMSEFYQQGDIERNELNLEPIDLMNREKMNELPKMQIGFIDTICAPIYTAFAKLFPNELGPLLDGCLANRELWTEMAATNFKPDTSNIKYIADDSNDNSNVIAPPSQTFSKSETEIHLKLNNTCANSRDGLPLEGEKSKTIKSDCLECSEDKYNILKSIGDRESDKLVGQRMSI